jgi:uncharacterized protein HemY
VTIVIVVIALTLLYLIVCVVVSRIRSLRRLGEDYETFFDGEE